MSENSERPEGWWSSLWSCLSRPRACLRRLWDGLRVRASLLRPIWLPATLVTAVSLALVHPQSQDVIADISEREGSDRLFRDLRLMACVALFCIASWIFPRALLRADFPTARREEDERYVRWRLLVPWFLGILPLILLTVSASWRKAAFLAWQSAALLVVALVFLTWKYCSVRAALAGDPAELDPADPEQREKRERMIARRREVVPCPSSLSRTARILLLTVLAVSFAVLLTFLLAPVWAPQQVGALGVVCLAGAGWLATSSILLVYPSYRYDLPSLPVVLLFWGVFCSFFADNHELRSLEAREEQRARPSVQTHFGQWKRDLLRSCGKVSESEVPVFLVAAEGGGIRAAYWTAAVLAFLEERFPGFHRHVYAISGVSGGSLGGAAFVAALAEQGDDEEPAVLGERVRTMLGQDFLAPTLGGAVSGDFVQNFSPLRLGMPDRAECLERAWEQAWRTATGDEEGSDRFAQDFLDLYDGVRGRPSLFMNGTWASGARLITSNVAFDPGDFGGATDLLAELDVGLRLSTAVHNSARFTYVSPAGTVPPSIVGRIKPPLPSEKAPTVGRAVRRRTAEQWTPGWRKRRESPERRERRDEPEPEVRSESDSEPMPEIPRRWIVDGGYFENSGALTATQIAEAIRGEAGDMPVYGIVLLNSPEHLDPPTAVSAKLAQALAPIRTLLGTRGQRGLLAMEDFERDLRSSEGSGEPDERVFTFQLPLLGTREAPLGWMLAKSTRDAIDRALQALEGEVESSAEQILGEQYERVQEEVVEGVDFAIDGNQQSLQRFDQMTWPTKQN